MIAEVRGLDSLYMDRSAEPMTKYFYYLVMTDAFGEKSLNSAKVFGLYKSSVIPFPPMNLRSEIVTNGVKLVWEKPGSFINVYHVYRNLGDDNSLSLISNVKSSDSIVIFNDTSSVLKGNRNYIYAVKSETTSGVESNFSDTLRIKPIKKTLLEAPLQLKGYSDKSKVFLYWDNLFKDDPSVNGYYVFRRDANVKSKQGDFKAVKDSLISAKQNNFVDTTVFSGNNYEYAVQTVDIYGNKSPFSSTINVQIKKSVPAAPAGITAVNTPSGILISWTAPIQLDIKEFKIYRYERGQTPELLDDVNAKLSIEYLDKQAQKGILYFYYLISVDKYNSESKPSSEVGIRR
jgi:fibronectin type 3 domain-containing protein